LLVGHFLSQFVEYDVAPDSDRHQLLALVAAALITLPLLTTVFMSVKYLIQPLQTPAWTQLTAITDRMVFCATSMLVSAIIATLEWDALSLSTRDSAILGVLPLSHREIVRAKVVAIVTFAMAVILALNALPALLHPLVMASNLPLNLLMAAPLIAARGLSTMAAGAFGFASVVAIRECLYLVVGRRRFRLASDIVRSALLLSLLVLLLLVPGRLLGTNEWILAPNGGHVLARPVGWFVAMDTVMASKVLDDLPRPDLSTWDAEEDDRRVTQYQNGLRHMAGRALSGAGVLLVLLMVSAVMYLWNARRLHVLPDERGGPAFFPVWTVMDVLAKVVARRPATRAGLLFLSQTVLGSPVHRLYLIAAVAIGTALLLGMAPSGIGSTRLPVRASQLAAQTLVLTAIIAGFRATIRTSADPRATWLFGVADTGNLCAFRNGVRVGTLTAVVATVFMLVPLHAAAWGIWIASMHALNGAALGWLLVEVACGNVEQPLVRTIPPNDALNTVGAVSLGAIVISVFILARIEHAMLTSGLASILFALAMGSLAMWVRHIHEREHRAATMVLASSVSVVP
jgi:hypothetical protein